MLVALWQHRCVLEWQVCGRWVVTQTPTDLRIILLKMNEYIRLSYIRIVSYSVTRINESSYTACDFWGAFVLQRDLKEQWAKEWWWWWKGWWRDPVNDGVVMEGPWGRSAGTPRWWKEWMHAATGELRVWAPRVCGEAGTRVGLSGRWRCEQGGIVPCGSRPLKHLGVRPQPSPRGIPQDKYSFEPINVEKLARFEENFSGLRELSGIQAEKSFSEKD